MSNREVLIEVDTLKETDEQRQVRELAERKQVEILTEENNNGDTDV